MILSPAKFFIRNSTKNFCHELFLQVVKVNYRSHTFMSSRYNAFFNIKQVINTRSLYLSNQLQKGITITFIKDDGTEVKRRARIGETIQDLVQENDPEINGYGVCGGVTACSTCHVIFPKEVYDKLEPATSEEEDLIDFAPDHCETSRLGCNVIITEAMDGVVLRVPSAKKDQRP